MQTRAAQCSRARSGAGRDTGEVVLKAGRRGTVRSTAPGRGLAFSEVDKAGSPWFSLVVGNDGRDMPLGRPESPGRPDSLVALGMARQLGPASMGMAKLARPMPLTDRAMRVQPESNRILRPARSTSPMAVRVATTFTMPSPTEASTAEDPPWKPTEWKMVEA